MYSREVPSNIRTGDLSEIKYCWTKDTAEHAVLVATCLKKDPTGKTVGVYAAYKEAFDVGTELMKFATENHWYEDLKYEIADQINNPVFGHFDLETYISIHNTSIRTRA